jgi:integron integrase
MPFLYKHVLKQPLDKEINAERAPQRLKIPVVLTREEVSQVIALMSGIHQLVVKLLYGSGLRIIECLRLRVQDIDFAMKSITVRDGKGAKDRVTTFPTSLIKLVSEHLTRVKLIHDQDLKAGHGEVYMPHALARKYPHAAMAWGWQYVFPAEHLSTDPRSGHIRRHHLDPSPINKAIANAVHRAGTQKQVSAHTFRHYAATHFL